MIWWTLRRRTFHLGSRVVMEDRDLINLKGVNKAIPSTTATQTQGVVDQQNTQQASNNKITMIKELKNLKIYLVWALTWSRMEIWRKWRRKGIKISSTILCLCLLPKLSRLPQFNSLWHQSNSQLLTHSNNQLHPQSNSRLPPQFNSQLLTHSSSQ